MSAPAQPTFGYPSKDRCRVCGKRKNNQIEPRFGYVVCEDHQDTPPVQIPPLGELGPRS